MRTIKLITGGRTLSDARTGSTNYVLASIIQDQVLGVTLFDPNPGIFFPK